MTYTVRTDAALCERIEARNVDEACGRCGELFGGATTLRQAQDYIIGIADGAWCWIEDDETGERHGVTEAGERY